MKELLLIFWWFSVSCRLFAGSDVNCTARLLNGDRIQGVYQGQDREFVLLNTGNTGDPLRIHGKYIDALDFGLKESVGHADYRIQLSAEQHLMGRILKYSDGQIYLQTAWADQLILDRDYLQEIERGPYGNKVIFRGSESPEKWEYSAFVNDEFQKKQVRKMTKFVPEPSGEWVVSGEGDLATTLPLLNQGIGIRLGLELPEIVAGDSLKVILEGFPEMSSTSRNRSGFLQIIINHQRLAIEETPATEARGVMFGQRSLLRGSMDRPPPGRLDLWVEYDPEHSRYRVKNRDKVVAEWELPGSLLETKAYTPRIRFEWAFYTDELAIREVLVYLRENSLPAETAEMPEGVEAVLFQNGDSLKVEWKGIDEKGDWILALNDLNSVTTMDPNRIQLWLNRGGDLKEIRRVARHVEVKLSGEGGRFIAELEKADGDSFTFKREGWVGSTRLPFSMVEELKFNPYF